jgi:hypothetical protein
LFVEDITLKKFQQDGKVEDIPRVTVNANDVRLDDKLVIKLSHNAPSKREA